MGWDLINLGMDATPTQRVGTGADVALKAGGAAGSPSNPQEYTSPAAGGRKETPAQEEAVGAAAVRMLQDVE